LKCPNFVSPSAKQLSHIFTYGDWGGGRAGTLGGRGGLIKKKAKSYAFLRKALSSRHLSMMGRE